MFHRESGFYKTTYAADMELYPLPITKIAMIVIGVLFFGLFPSIMTDYYLSIINLCAIAVVGALGLNILVGYTGQISVGHAAFMSVGAYTAANLATVIRAACGSKAQNAEARAQTMIAAAGMAAELRKGRQSCPDRRR